MEFLNDALLNAQEKTEKVLAALKAKECSPQAFITAVGNMKEAEVANVMQAFGELTADGSHGSQEMFDFAVRHIEASSLRLKCESSTVAGNIVARHLRNIDKAVSRLLVNTEDAETEVRSTAAYALGEILKLNIPEMPALKNSLEMVVQREIQESIREIYHAAIRRFDADSHR